MFVPYHFRPFWQPNSRAASPSTLHQDGTQLEKLIQKLDAAEKKVDEYSRLIASLFAELRRYQDTICHSCRVNVTHASLAAGSLQIPTGLTQSASQYIATALTLVSKHTSAPLPNFTTASIQIEAEPSLPIASSSETHDPSSGTTQQAPIQSPTNSTPDNLTASPDIDTPQIAIITAVPHSNSEPSQTESLSVSETAAPTQPNPDCPDWSVEYNPEIEKGLNLHVANTFTFAGSVLCTKYSHDGKYLAVGLANGEVHVYDMVRGSKRICILVERPATVYTGTAPTFDMIWTVRFSLDNQCIATGGRNGQINIWEIDRRRLRATFKHNGLVRCIDFSPNNHFLVSASHDDSVCLWGMRDGSRRTLHQHDSHSFMSVAFSPSGRYVAAGNDDGFVRIWDVRTGRLVGKCQIDDGTVVLRSVVLRGLMFTRNEQGIAVGGHTLQFWDVSSLKEIQSGRHIITDDSEIPMKQIFESKEHSTITALSSSCDNRWVLSSSLDRNVHIWDAQSGGWVCTLKGHTEDVWAADFSPAGHYIASGSDDCRVRLWRYEMVE